MCSLCWGRLSAQRCSARQVANWSKPVIAGTRAWRGWTASTNGYSGPGRHNPGNSRSVTRHPVMPCSARREALAMFRVGGGPRSVGRRHGRVSKLGRAAYPAGFVLMTIDPPGLGSQRSATTSRSAASILRRTLQEFAPKWADCLRSSVREGVARAASGVPCHGVPGILIENDVHHWG